MSNPDHGFITTSITELLESHIKNWAEPNRTIAQQIIAPCVEETIGPVEMSATWVLIYIRIAIVLSIIAVICVIWAIISHSWLPLSVGAVAVAGVVWSVFGFSKNTMQVAAYAQPAGIAALGVGAVTCLMEKTKDVGLTTAATALDLAPVPIYGKGMSFADMRAKAMAAKSKLLEVSAQAEQKSQELKALAQQAQTHMQTAQDKVRQFTDQAAQHVQAGIDQAALHVQAGIDQAALHVQAGIDQAQTHMQTAQDQVRQFTDQAALHVQAGIDQAAQLSAQAEQLSAQTLQAAQLSATDQTTDQTATY